MVFSFNNFLYLVVLGRKTRTWYTAGEIIVEEVVVELDIQETLYCIFL